MRELLRKYFELIRKFLPKQKVGSSVGIDIGITECKLVEIRKSGESFELVNWAIQPIDSGDLKTAFQKVLEALQEPAKNPYTSISGKGTLIRYIDMPKMSLEDLRGSFAIEADKYFPFPQDQIYTDCYIIDSQSKPNKMAVMAGASKKELVDARVKLLTDMGLQANFIGLNPVALANVVNVLGFGDDAENKDIPVAIFDVGEFVSSLTIMVNRVPRFSRDIHVGGRDFTKRISNALGVTFEEAEVLKKEPGDKAESINRACESVLTSIVQEMSLSLDYFTTEGNPEVTKIYLTGGASLFPGTQEALENNLGLKIKRWSPLQPVVIPDAVKSEKLNKNAFKLGVALGLALYNYD